MTTTYSIDLRPSEITLLCRALAGDAKFYQELMVKSKPQWEKDDMRQRMEAAERLSERLMKEVRPADVIGQAVLDRVMTELLAYGENHFADDEEGWEDAARAIVESLTKNTMATNQEKSGKKLQKLSSPS